MKEYCPLRSHQFGDETCLKVNVICTRPTVYDLKQHNSKFSNWLDM